MSTIRARGFVLDRNLRRRVDKVGDLLEVGVATAEAEYYRQREERNFHAQPL